MRPQRITRTRRALAARPVDAAELHRWVDDGGTVVAEATPRPVPVTWSPVTLSALLEAQRALESLTGRHRRAVTARVDRIVAHLEGRRLSQPAGAAALRAVSADARSRRRAAEAARRPHAWELLRRPAAVG